MPNVIPSALGQLKSRQRVAFLERPEPIAIGSNSLAMATKSTTSRRRRKPSDSPLKPTGAPIWPHPSGYRAKKIGGEVIYFGAWRKRVKGEYVILPNNGEDQAAYARYKAEIDGIDKDIEAGRRPRTGQDGYHKTGETTIAGLCN